MTGRSGCYWQNRSGFCHAQSGDDHAVRSQTLLLNEYEGKHVKIRCIFIDKLSTGILILQGTVSVTVSTSDWFQLIMIFVLTFTFFHLVWIYAWVSRVPNLASSIYLSATQIFDLLESELPSDFNRKFGLSWNLLKASVGSQRGKAQCPISTNKTEAQHRE